METVNLQYTIYNLQCPSPLERLLPNDTRVASAERHLVVAAALDADVVEGVLAGGGAEREVVFAAGERHGDHAVRRDGAGEVVRSPIEVERRGSVIADRHQGVAAGNSGRASA